MFRLDHLKRRHEDLSWSYHIVKFLEEKNLLDKNLFLLVRYVNEVVGTRKLPPSANKISPKVVMKMDIEVSLFYT